MDYMDQLIGLKKVSGYSFEDIMEILHLADIDHEVHEEPHPTVKYFRVSTIKVETNIPIIKATGSNENYCKAIYHIKWLDLLVRNPNSNTIKDKETEPLPNSEKTGLVEIVNIMQ